MEFDSLAFSAVRSTPAQEARVYCPACQEECVPEEPPGDSRDPTCPTCGEATMVRPPPEVAVVTVLSRVLLVSFVVRNY